VGGVYKNQDLTEGDPQGLLKGIGGAGSLRKQIVGGGHIKSRSLVRKREKRAIKGRFPSRGQVTGKKGD